MYIERPHTSRVAAVLPQVSKILVFLIFSLEANTLYWAVSLNLIKLHILVYFPVVGFLFVLIIFGIGLMVLISRDSPAVVILGLAFLAVFKAIVYYAPPSVGVYSVSIIFTICAALPAVLLEGSSFKGRLH